MLGKVHHRCIVWFFFYRQDLIFCFCRLQPLSGSRPSSFMPPLLNGSQSEARQSRTFLLACSISHFPVSAATAITCNFSQVYSLAFGPDDTHLYALAVSGALYAVPILGHGADFFIHLGSILEAYSACPQMQSLVTEKKLLQIHLETKINIWLS